MGSGRGASSGLPTTPGRGCGQGMWARAGDRGWGQGLRVGAGDRGCGSRQGLEGGGCGQGAVGRGWGTEGSHRVPLTIGVRQQRGPDCRQLCPCCPQLCLALNIWEGKGSGSVPCQGCLRAPACSWPLPGITARPPQPWWHLHRVMRTARAAPSTRTTPVPTARVVPSVQRDAARGDPSARAAGEKPEMP